MTFDDLSPELREKALACKTSDELVQLAHESGIELSDEQLEAISGGFEWTCSDEKCENYDPYDW